MKNLFLTLALMFCVSFAFASDKVNVSKKSHKNRIEKKSTSNEVKPNSNLLKLKVTECFGLSCTTHCVTLNEPLDDEESVKAWVKLEAFWCGS